MGVKLHDWELSPTCNWADRNSIPWLHFLVAAQTLARNSHQQHKVTRFIYFCTMRVGGIGLSILINVDGPDTIDRWLATVILVFVVGQSYVWFCTKSRSFGVKKSPFWRHPIGKTWTTEAAGSGYAIDPRISYKITPVKKSRTIHSRTMSKKCIWTLSDLPIWPRKPVGESSVLSAKWYQEREKNTHNII